MTPHHMRAIDPKTEHALRLFFQRAAIGHSIRDGLLFGSRARGDARPDSDADVAVVLDGPRGRFMETKLELADIAFDTLLDTGIHIQPLPLWATDWDDPDSWLNPELLRAVQRTGISVWPVPPT